MLPVVQSRRNKQSVVFHAYCYIYYILHNCIKHLKGQIVSSTKTRLAEKTLNTSLNN